MKALFGNPQQHTLGCLRGVSSCPRVASGWMENVACGPCSPELSNSYSDTASKIVTFAFTFTLMKIQQTPQILACHSLAPHTDAAYRL